MTTEGPHKLAQLPGYDTAPDVYETGDATDGDTTTSTQQTHSQVPSEASDTSEEEDDAESYGRKGHRRNGSIFHDAPTTVPPASAGADQEDITNEQTLSRVSAFDSRLAALESALGISALDNLTESQATPILPSLTLLDHQLASLTSATNLSSLEQISSRIQKLKLEAQTLAHLQQQSANGKPSSSHAEDDEDEEAPTLLTSEDMTRLQSLYTLLPTLQSLSPTVPALMTRLRSLRTLHTTAANASADLESLEQRQAEMDQELKMWREGLEKVEEAVKNADEANGRNGSTVRGWVDDLEKRVKALGR
ncbi:hypothetical protein HII31_00245 [Pseudocercospora fuligena]|uniref:Dynactin subunit n=1 Tax=Pseudocercospora fuligena TaxID=685502 RepID=A0A8H6RWN5_9PEZI|nr:hypothetical protein HII31_00245 [Pseudocercospora fuligena]